MTDLARHVDHLTQPENPDLTTGRVPVLVVGAGPTGLLLASELHRRGVQCHVIDARPAPLHWDRATVVHPLSLQIFEAMGLVEKLLDVGCRQRIVRVYSGGNLLGTVDLSTSGSIYGFNLGVSEEVTESILTDALHKHGGQVIRSSRLVALTPHPGGVRAEIEHENADYNIDARWVVGCDGIHSATRELTGIAFEGHELAKQWAVFDTTVEGWTDTYEGIFAFHDLLPIILTALPNQRWRVYLRPSSDDSDLVAEATSTLRLYLPSASFINVENPTRFNCYTKVAAQFRSGSVFLAGDSAHLCSPAEGHGMNTGLQDAFNLAWKLALVHHGFADPTLLDSYHAERRPIAETITHSGDLFEQAQTLTDPAQRDQRDQALRTMLTDPEELNVEVMAETELISDYSLSPIVIGDASHHLAAGFRLPDNITVQASDAGPRRLHQLAHRAGHTLILLAGPTAQSSQLLDLHTALEQAATGSPIFEVAIALSTRADLPVHIGQLDPSAAHLLGVEGITLLAIRPDGYIGLRSDWDHLAALARYRALIQSSNP
ncbi:MAG TPA: FAD-dependent monooxygenase [Acidobacteriaceae bacterium]|nr:FAD-dependent monooxygenase [Acidobacteriaceae bacterium]